MNDGRDRSPKGMKYGLSNGAQGSRLYGGPNDSELDSLSTGPLAYPIARSLALLTRSLAHFAHSLARGKGVILDEMNASPAYSFNPLCGRWTRFKQWI